LTQLELCNEIMLQLLKFIRPLLCWKQNFKHIVSAWEFSDYEYTKFEPNQIARVQDKWSPNLRHYKI